MGLLKSKKILFILPVVALLIGYEAYSMFLVKKPAPAPVEASLGCDLLLNLADSSHFIRIGIVISANAPVAMAAAGSGGTCTESNSDAQNPPALLNADQASIATNDAIDVIRSFTSTQLLVPDGQEKLRAALKTSFNSDASLKLHVDHVYLVDFLIQ